MSPFRLSRPAIRALSLTAISVGLVTISLAWASRQQASTPSFKSAGSHPSSALFADKGGIAPAAATITVNSLSDVANGSDGLCTLREAITAANNNAASGAAAGECAAGSSSGADAIDMTGLTGTINLIGVLPDITSDLTITGPGANLLTIQRSTADGTPDFRVFNIQNGQVSLSKMTIANGSTTAGQGGAGILNSNGTLALDGALVSNNNSAGPGGALQTNAGATTVTNCLMVGNHASNGGAIAIQGSGVLIVRNSTLSDNFASALGGGMYAASSATGTLTNVTITNNRSDVVGGVRSESSGLTLENTIVVGNFLGAAPSTTPSDFSGVLNVSSLRDLIGPGGCGGIPEGGNNQCGVTNAGLGPLSNNGGPTQTHALLRGSPALEYGSNALASNFGVTSDQRGFTRIVDTVDAGAFEAQVSLDDIADKTTNEDVQLQFAFNVHGAITSATASSDNAALVPNNSANIAVTGTGSTRTLTINPLANQFGNATITVSVGDANGQSMTDTFLLTVNSVNDAPSFTRGANQTVNEDAGAQTVPGWATNISPGPNEAGQTVNFTVTNNNNGLFSAQPAVGLDGTLIYTPAVDGNGSATVTVSLKDNGGTANGGVDTFSQTFTITVNAINDAPSFTKGPDQTVNEDSGMQFLSRWATNLSVGAPNESSQSLTFQVTTNTNPTLFQSGPAVDAVGDLAFAPATNANGTATITIVAKDNGGTGNGGVDTSAPQTFTVTVNAVNDPPVFTKGANQTVANNAGAQTVSNWATNISPGPANESSQTVVFQVTNVFNPSLFSVLPAVSPTGTLTYTPAPNAGGSTTIFVNLKDNGGTANNGVDTSAAQSFTITVNPIGGFFSFAASSGTTTENSGSATITVRRTGDTSRAASVDYATNADNGLPCSSASGVASPKCDFTAALGTLNFAAGDINKTITILIGQDSFVEGSETITITLTNPQAGSALTTQASMGLTISDDVPETTTNVIDDANLFVRMHYHDFLNREADQSGLDFWTGQMTNCGNSDLTVCRVNVSGAFFLSIEFQQTGYLVERIYKTAYGDAPGTSQIGGSHQISVPVVRANEFLADTQRVSRGVVVGQTGWETALENNKQAYALEFVQRSRFITAFPTSMTPPAFVSHLNQNAGNVLSPSELAAAIAAFGPPPAGGDTNNVSARAQVLRQIAEDADLYNAEFNRAFVLTQYFGYLRRNPNDAPESSLDYTGYDFWLGKLIQFNGNYVAAEMVKAFIASPEYRQRFGP